jgi:hypothetical protein
MMKQNSPGNSNLPQNRAYYSSKNTDSWDAFKAVSIIDVFWDFVPCSSISNRRFGERTVSIFRGP